MIRTQISMTEDQARGLRRLSAIRKRSQAALMRDALDSLFEDADRAPRIAAARGAIGSFASGHTDTSADHDRALDEAFET